MSCMGIVRCVDCRSNLVLHAHVLSQHNIQQSVTGLLSRELRIWDHETQFTMLDFVTDYITFPEYFSVFECSTLWVTLYFESANARGAFWVSARRPKALKCPKGNLWLLSFPSTVSSLSGFVPLRSELKCVDSPIENHSGDWLNGQRPRHNLDFITQNKHVASGPELLSPCQSVLKFNRL